ncbi:MAG: phosphoribosyltransferase family protein [Patescibacteria group bacterium]|jgi:orotate phosphoribosyltransferase
MKESEIQQTLRSTGAVITDSHIVYTSGKHGTAYINKDAVYPHTIETSHLCRAIAERFADNNVEVVIAPAIGGVILSQWVAFHLSMITRQDVLGIYAEKDEQSVIKANEDMTVTIEITLRQGDELVIKKPEFVIKRGYDKLVVDKNVLAVEDVLTTGGSAKRVVEATQSISDNIVGLGVLCNRGGVKREDVADVPRLEALLNVQLDAWDEADCPRCKDGVPINTDVGKGREFLARQKA